MQLTLKMIGQVVKGLRSDPGRGSRELRREPRVGMRCRHLIFPDLLEDYVNDGLMVRIRDMSLSGMGIASPRVLPRGTRFVLKFKTDNAVEARLTYRVMHCQKVSSAMFVLGARFDHLDCTGDVNELDDLKPLTIRAAHRSSSEAGAERQEKGVAAPACSNMQHA